MNICCRKIDFMNQFKTNLIYKTKHVPCFTKPNRLLTDPDIFYTNKFNEEES